MDLGGRPNMDLTEAARLMKQSTATPTGTNPAQIQTPPLMMMQQAVAMQQFQFQQALLMQQVMATQQAAARAATVKSAAEMAAARAAEISKQLKGSDGEDEEKKPASPDRSKSRSASRSKSRSPIRYRRDRSRSLSRSPIRYRRDRPYSPSRSRDHFSYRSRSRRGYYRGRGDYPWNPFRREWDRDRDRDFYSRSRRSRSRSRSRVRRRSRSRSRSPRFRRERSVSPRHRRDDRKAARSARRSRSRDVKRTPSVSSRSPSASPHGKEGSRSPFKKQQGSGLSPVRRGPSGSPVPQIVRRVGKNLSSSPLEDDQIRSPDYKGRGDRVQMKAPSIETDSVRKSGLPKAGPSVSPRRSPSVSFNHSLRKDLQSDDDEDVNSDLKRTTSLRVSSNGEDDTGDIQPDLASATPNVPSQAVKGMGSGSDISSEGGNVDFKAKEQFLGKQSRPPWRGERSAKDSGVVPGQESDDDKELDDWRDDMKAHSKEKIGRKDERKVHDKKNEEEIRLVTENTLAHDRSRVEVSWDASRATKKHGIGESDIDMEQLDDDSGRDRHGRIGVAGGKERLQDSSRDKARSLYEVKDYVVSEVNESGGAKYVDKDYQEPGKENSVESVKEDERDFEETVFEGPKLEAEEDEGFFESVKPAKMDEYKNIQREVDQVSAHPRARDDSDVEDEEDVKVTRSKLVTLEDDVVVSRKGKEKSRPKDRRLDEEEEREKRKERHRKHKKKHRREAEDEKDEDEDDNDDVEGRKERRRHKRKHRKEDDDERRERKKRKHKSRGKSGSDSAGESSRADVEVKDEGDGSPVRKKSSSRHRKRRRDPSKSPANSASSSD
ncbi:hypothetical protein MPTK2_1g21380 [Marchantia polymorpha subsp. ruderalis]